MASKIGLQWMRQSLSEDGGYARSARDLHEDGGGERDSACEYHLSSQLQET